MRDLTHPPGALTRGMSTEAGNDRRGKGAAERNNVSEDIGTAYNGGQFD